MTALAALWRLDRGPEPGVACTGMLDAQRIFCADRAAVWHDAQLALGHRLQHAPAQTVAPVIGGGGRYVLAADIRLDHRDDLVAALGLAPAAAGSDAEILMRGVERWGEGVLDRICGDFAFVLWDARQRSLRLVRDPLGQRPLHYHRGNGFVAAASMPVGLHALAEISRAPDIERFAEFVALVPEHGPRTFFRDIARVEPGEVVTFGAEKFARRSYWHPEAIAPRRRRPDDLVDELRARLDRAVDARLRGPGAIGSHLSGGLDSAAVTATAARLLAPRGAGLTAFTAVPRAGFAPPADTDRIFDEGPQAALLAAMHPAIRHVLVETADHSPLADLGRAAVLFGRPSPNTVNLGWLFAINDAATARGVTILLNGVMGNLGFSYAGRAVPANLFRRGPWGRWLRPPPAAMRGPGSRGVLGYAALAPGQVAAFSLDARLARLSPPPGGGVAARAWALRHSDSGYFIKGVLGGWGIELRDPLADRRLIEFCLGIADADFVRDGVARWPARQALADRLPRALIEERRAAVQAADWQQRLSREDLADELSRIGDCAAAASLLDLPRLRALVDSWPDADAQRADVIQRYQGTLLRAISAGYFLRQIG